MLTSRQVFLIKHTIRSEISLLSQVFDKLDAKHSAYLREIDEAEALHKDKAEIAILEEKANAFYESVLKCNRHLMEMDATFEAFCKEYNIEKT